MAVFSGVIYVFVLWITLLTTKTNCKPLLCAPHLVCRYGSGAEQQTVGVVSGLCHETMQGCTESFENVRLRVVGSKAIHCRPENQDLTMSKKTWEDWLWS